MRSRRLSSRARLRLAVLVGLVVGGPMESAAGVIDVSAYRFVSSSATLTYTPVPCFPLLGMTCGPRTVTDVDGESWNGLGAWDASVSSSVSAGLFSTTVRGASASQTSNVSLAGDRLEATATGLVSRFGLGGSGSSGASSHIDVQFSIDAGQYAYDVRVSGPYVADYLSFASRTSSGVLDPGDYLLGFTFQASSIDHSYGFDLELTPYSTPGGPAPDPVPEPTSLLLVTAGLACLARRRHSRRSRGHTRGSRAPAPVG